MYVEFHRIVSVLRPRTEEEIVLLSFARSQDMLILPPIGSRVTFGKNGGSITVRDIWIDAISGEVEIYGEKTEILTGDYFDGMSKDEIKKSLRENPKNVWISFRGWEFRDI